jgi:hypothetical protein
MGEPHHPENSNREIPLHKHITGKVENPVDVASLDIPGNVFSTIYNDDTLCYTSTKVEDLPYSWLLRNAE